MTICARGVYKIYPHPHMPPYENESLHDMHALMQQLDTLNAAHAPEHLEMFSTKKKDENTTPAKDPKPGMFTRVIGSITGKTAAPAALTEQDVVWKNLKGGQRKTVLKNAFDSILQNLTEDDYVDLKTMLESNVKTKGLFVACINSNVPAS